MSHIQLEKISATASRRSGYWCWAGETDDVEVRFTGRGPKASRDEIFAAISNVDSGVTASELKQIHSNTVVQAVAGNSGQGDALLSSNSRLTLTIATADCVPILFSAGSRMAAVHAGWRGIAGGIVSEVARLISDQSPRVTAWIGPSIGPCCYEVGNEVANALEPSKDGPGLDIGQRNVDLGRIVVNQLKAFDIHEIHHVEVCTKCNPDLLWSYRGEEQRPGGQNIAFIWRKTYERRGTH